MIDSQVQYLSISVSPNKPMRLNCRDAEHAEHVCPSVSSTPLRCAPHGGWLYVKDIAPGLPVLRLPLETLV